jgi:hypothetical protein
MRVPGEKSLRGASCISVLYEWLFSIDIRIAVIDWSSPLQAQKCSKRFRPICIPNEEYITEIV